MNSIAYLIFALICVALADQKAAPPKIVSSNLRGSVLQSLMKDHPDLVDKLNANPDVMQFLQKHQELAEKVKADPSVLDRFLAAREAKNGVDKESTKLTTVTTKDSSLLKDDKKKSKEDSTEKPNKSKEDSTEKPNKKAVKKDSKEDSTEKLNKKAAKKDNKEQSRKSKKEDSSVKGETVEQGQASETLELTTEDVTVAPVSSQVVVENRRLSVKDNLVMSHPDLGSSGTSSQHPRRSRHVDSLMMDRPEIIATAKSHQDLVDKVRMHPEVMQRLTIDKMINEKIIH